jgi:hypothetical protein
MSESVFFYYGDAGAVALPFALEELLADWASLRLQMTRAVAPGFERDEWAYVIQFISEEHLAEVYASAFGARREDHASPGLLLRPRGTVAIWLPNNVSLLGPLSLVLLSITGNRLLLKGGSRSEDLSGAFLAYVFEHLRPGVLREHLEANVHYAVFDRADERNARYAAEAQVRVFFGSDAAAAAIDALPHLLESSYFAFIDRRSEAWIEPICVDDELVETLCKVFGIYGQAGCTSPRRVVLLGGDERQAADLRERLVETWQRLMRQPPAPHQASANVMAQQWAAALGWDARLTDLNGAVFASGTASLEPIEASMALAVVGLEREVALAELPENIQTIGHALEDATDPAWLQLVAGSRVKRFVPLARMHHFGSLWDGANFWRQTFEEVEFDL